MATDDRLAQVTRNSGLTCVDVEFGGLAIGRHEFRFTADAAELPTTVHRPDRRYLVASITKPILAMAVLKLAAEGHLSLTERIGNILPAFNKGAFRRINSRHLLTHTSGFPDMPADNTELRASHAGLGDFLRRAATTALEYGTGTDSRYSSIGFLILSAIVQQTAGESSSVFLQREFFGPLRMTDTRLGLTSQEADNYLLTVVPSILPIWQPNADTWGWNSRYWRTLGAPWGGLLSTTADLGRFATMMLNDGTSPDGRQLIAEAAVAASMNDQMGEYSSQPSFIGSPRSWGFGWRRQWAGHPGSFGDFVSSKTIGHWGATGTLLWIDPETRRYAVILTNNPYEGSCADIQRISNVAATTPNRRGTARDCL